MERIALVYHHMAKGVHHIFSGIKVGAVGRKGRVILLKGTLVNFDRFLSVYLYTGTAL